MADDNGQKILDVFIKDLKSTINVRNEINKQYLEIRGGNINQQREFYKHIAILLVAIMGLSSITGKLPINEIHFFIGVILGILLIIFIISYLREVLDKESVKLASQQDEYNEILQKKIELINQYLGRGQFTAEIAQQYIKNLTSLPEAKLLLDRERELDDKRKERSEKSGLDYTGEFIIFVFIVSFFFIVISFWSYKLNLYQLILSILLIFYLSFQDIPSFFIKKLSKSISFLKKHKILL